MNDHSLTAIITTHNRPESLQVAIQSVQAQSVPVTLIVVDDGSAPAVQADDLPPGTFLVRNDSPQGAGAARNRGVEAAQTGWVGFLDDDDLWLPEKAESVLNAIGRYPTSNVIFHSSSYRPSDRSRGVRKVDDPLRRMLHEQPPHISGVSVRKTVHLEMPFDETIWATEDLDYLIRLAHVPPWVEIRRDLSRHMDPGLETSAINIESRIEGRLDLMERYGDLIRSDPAAHSFYYVRLGYQYRRGGHHEEARSCFMQAVRLRPTSGLAWRGLIRVLFFRSGPDQ
jgi:glycosyltransferase involved in cell wall biosynthesis